MSPLRIDADMPDKTLLEKLEQVLVRERSKLLTKMIRDREAGRQYLEDDRLLLLKINEVLILLKKHLRPPTKTWVEKVIKQLTGE